MTNHVFVAGGTGFIGSNLVNRLSEDHHVYSLSRKPLREGQENVENIEGDILNARELAPFLKNCDVLFHCAAHISFQKRDYQKAYDINVEGTRSILDAALEAGVKKVVHLSACAVLGFSKQKNILIDERADPTIGKDNVYAYTKKLAEDEVQKYVRKGLDISIANIATVYGQGDRALNSGSIIKAIHGGRMKMVPPGGTSFVSVDDLIDGLLLLSQKGKAGERYILCSENMEYKTLATRIASVLGVKAPQATLPRCCYYPALWAAKGLECLGSLSKGKVNLVTAQIIKESFGFKYFDSTKAKEQLGWNPVQSLEQAVEKAVQFYKYHHLF